MLHFFSVGILKRILVLLNIVALIIFIASAINPFLPLENWTGAGFLGIIFPYSLILLMVCFILDVLFKPRWAILLAIILTLHWKQISVLFAHNFRKTTFEITKKNTDNIRIMTWNVRRFQPLTSNNMYDLRLSIAHRTLLQKYKPDILCIQEFMTQHSGTKKQFNIMRTFLSEFGYQYNFYSKDYDLVDNFSSGNILYSKYPILHTERIHLVGKDRKDANSIIIADLLINQKDTIRVCTTHLESYGLQKREYEEIQKIKNQHDTNLTASKQLLKKIRTSFLIRKKQIDLIVKTLKKSSYPIILSGDFNDVPVSYTYFSLTDFLEDTFLAKGFGIGSTYTQFLPMLRIDYILCSKQFKVLQTEVISEPISDHLPLVSDLLLFKN